MHSACHSAPATRPALEVADILRARLDRYRDTHQLSPQQHRAANALVRCRTAALGGFASQCDACGATTVQYASCRNRHCPKCQTLTQTRWVERQCDKLLDIGYWHVYGKQIAMESPSGSGPQIQALGPASLTIVIWLWRFSVSPAICPGPLEGSFSYARGEPGRENFQLL